MNEISIADGNWLAGLVDGEGCFFLSTSRMRSTRGYGRKYRVLTFEFKVSLRADDMATMHLVHELLGVGRIAVHRKTAGKTTSPNAKPQVHLVVYRRQDIRRVVEVFCQYPLRSKKARVFSIWREAFERFETARIATPLQTLSIRDRFRTIPDSLFNEMARYAQALREARRYA